MEFRLGERVLIITNAARRFGCVLCGTVSGKIKGIDAYIINFIVGVPHLESFGAPNRHLELEWGRFTGQDGESIVLATEMGKT